MKKFFNTISFLTISLLIFTSILNAAATKRVLLEQFTGAWCGFCVDGSVIMDEILQQYPDQVIGVKFHNGDKMEIPETNILGNAMGLTGYPTGNVDRTVFNVNGQGAIFLDRSAWLQACQAVMNNPGIADINLKWSYDATSNKIIANISAKFDQAVSDEIRFNVYVVEDDVTGTGTGWDQHNYYSKDNPGGSAGGPSHPYYNLPPVITGYHHMKVVRATMGGPWGQANSIPTPVSAGATVKYSFELPVSSNWNINNIHLVGLVQHYSTNVGNRQTMNAALGVKTNTQTSISSTGDKLFAAPIGSTKELTVNIKNTGTNPIEYKLNLEKTQSTTWGITMEPSDNLVTIPGGDTYTLKLKMNIENIGSGEANLDIEETDGMAFNINFKGYSSDAQLLHIVYDPNADAAGLGTLIRTFPEYSTLMNITPSDYLSLYSSFPSTKLAIYTLGENGTLSSSDKDALNNLIAQKANIVFSGPLLFKTLDNSLQSIESQLGISWLNQNYQGQSSGKINIAGIPGDSISNGFSSQLSIYYLLQTAYILAPSIASKVITLQGNTDTVYATKSQLANSRVVCLGFNPMSITNLTQRNTLIYNALKWAYTAPLPAYPQISVAKGIDFGEVETNTSAEKNIPIKNIGKKDLVINSINVVDDSYKVYSITSTGNSTIAPGDSTIFTVKFAPTSTAFYTSSSVEISSNDPNNPLVQIALAGKGKKPSSSVKDEHIIGLTVSPMPANNFATINFNIPESAKYYNLNVVDINGKEVCQLNSQINIGENHIKLNTESFTSGTYFIVVTIDENTFTKKFNIAK
jgi:thiol-disulfide isomerase/thioredoxin